MTTTSPGLYPLAIERRLVQRLWGGQYLSSWLNLPAPFPEHLGETWEVFDNNMIRNGPMAGWSLAQATACYGEQLVGTQPRERYGSGFPLLIKFLDANDRLSLQVHPDDAYARLYEASTGFHGKTEAWYVLKAEPGADIIYGLNRSVERCEFEAAVRAGKLEQLANHVPVSEGDVILVPAGTLHAINAGIVLFEIQETSDLTYRVYDYGRIDQVTGTTRELHLDKALDVVEMTRAPEAKRIPLQLDGNGSRTLLVACNHFALEQWNVDTAQCCATQPDSMEIVTVIEGTGTLAWEGGQQPVSHGDSLVLPAALGEWSLQPGNAPMRVLRGYVPNLARDILGPLRRRGYNEAQIDLVVAATQPEITYG
jgi:mannose-6-phosphate isomerase